MLSADAARARLTQIRNDLVQVVDPPPGTLSRAARAAWPGLQV